MIGISSRRSLPHLMLFWWGILLIIPQGERLFLLQELTSIEPSTPALLSKTLFIGFVQDVLVTTLGVSVVAGIAFLLAAARNWFVSENPAHRSDQYRSVLMSLFIIFGVILLVVEVVEVNYYSF